MSRIKTRILGAALALMVPTLAAAQTAPDEYFDPEPYQVEAKYPVVTYPSGYVLNDNYPWESSMPFDPTIEYTPEEQQAVIDEEVRLSGGRLTVDTDGTPNIVIMQPTIPEATRDTSAPPTEIYEEDGQIPPPQLKSPGLISPTLAPATMSRHYVYGDDFGNSMFGAGFFIDTFVKATEATATTGKKVQAYIDGKVKATAFKHTEEVIRGRAEVAGQQGGTNSGTARLYVRGNQIYSKNLSASFTMTPINWTRDFFAVSKWFWVGPIPMKVRAALTGGVKLSVSGKISPTEAKLSVTPGGYVNVMASVGVDIIVLSFGVQGSLMLINVGLPATAELIWPLCSGLTWKLGSNLSLNALSGTIQLYARLKILFIKKTWYLTIANWPGYAFNIPLFTKSGSVGMGICPGFAPSSTPLTSVAELL
jgi:hypothetical protein